MWRDAGGQSAHAQPSDKYVGEKSLQKMLDIREENKFATIQDLMDRTKLTSRMIEYLAMAGAFVHSFDDEVPTLEDAKEALGSTITGRRIDKYWWKDKCSVLGEVILHLNLKDSIPYIPVHKYETLGFIISFVSPP